MVDLVNGLLGHGYDAFSGEMEDGEYVFDLQGLEIPFPALSDGYRAFLGWVVKSSCYYPVYNILFLIFSACSFVTSVV